MSANNRQSQSSAAKEKLLSSITLLPEITQVDNLIKSKLSSEAEQLTNVSSYLFSLGGKKIRPVLALLTAKAFSDQINQDVIKIAAGIELIHMATLLHDDIIDNSLLRRHHESPLSRFGINATLLTGDFLLTRAFGLCGNLEAFIVEQTEKTCVALTEGEIMETALHYEEHSLASSLEIARKKTAALFRLATLAPSRLTGCSNQVQSQMANFGEKLGIAFQIIDDILDVCSDASSFGKTPGSDLSEHKPSTVNILWLESGDPLAKKLLAAPEADQSLFVAAALRAIQASDIIPKAKKLALQYIADAKAALDLAVAHHGHCNLQIVNDLNILTEYAAERIS